MPILTIKKDEIKKYLGDISDKEIDNKLNLAGLGVERVHETEVDIEITPNRPDLLSLNGVKRYLENYFKKSGFREYNVEKPSKNYRVVIDKSVKNVRPFTSCAIVKGLKFTDEAIEEIIDIQEKLHGTYGRNRKKLAIGIYPLEKINLPIKFLAKKPEDIKFQPLAFPREINGRQILSQHPAGREYGDLLKEKDVFPVFEDSNGQVLSMPPIINSDKTGKIDYDTTDIFIECSGFDKEYLDKTLNMIVSALADIGGVVCSVEIEEEIGGKRITPNLEPEKMKIDLEKINSVLGLELNEKEIKNYFGKMGIGFEKDDEGLSALIPAYRTDILHEIDLAEEIAIAYGYENFIPEIPEISSIGEESEMEKLKRKISEMLIGLELIEVSSYHLSTKEKQFKKIGIKEFKSKMIEVLDSKTENNILRNSLLASSIQILSENSDASYPQRIFEHGNVFYHHDKIDTGIGESEKLCISLCHEKANFTELKQILDYIMRMFDLEYKIKETENPSFIIGRVGEIIVNGNSIGLIGEISPSVLRNNRIRMPVSSLEINLESLV
jgi:phenylalanyl-tRNA synthetase beta chain